MGAPGVFRGALVRRPLERHGAATYPGASGSHHGLDTANVPWELFVACCNGDGFDTRLLQQLHTDIDLEGLYDILECKEVQASWAAAAVLNAEEKAGRS